MKRGLQGKLNLLKEWWWLLGAVVGGIILWGNLPMRVAKAEQQIEDLKGWAKEIQGYTRAMQQTPNLPARSAPAKVWFEQSANGDWYCTDGQEAWWPNDAGGCE